MGYLLRVDKIGYTKQADAWGYKEFKVAPASNYLYVGWLAGLNADGDLVYAKSGATPIKAITVVYRASPPSPFDEYIENPATLQERYYTTGSREHMPISEQTKAVVVINDSTTAKQVNYFKMKETALTGTFTAVDGSDEVVGVGTAFTTELIVGDWITIAGVTKVQVATITDDTHLTLAVDADADVAGVTAVADGVYGAPLWLNEVTTGAVLPFTLLKPASNAQYIGRVVGESCVMYDISPIME